MIMTVPQGFTEQEWQSFIERGKALVTRENNAAWTWGDLVNEVIPVGHRGRDTGRALEQWVEEIEYEGEINTLRARRAVAAQWPNDIRISFVPWSIHQIFMSLEDRAEVIKSRPRWKATEARAFL